MLGPSRFVDLFLGVVCVNVGIRTPKWLRFSFWFSCRPTLKKGTRAPKTTSLLPSIFGATGVFSQPTKCEACAGGSHQDALHGLRGAGAGAHRGLQRHPPGGFRAGGSVEPHGHAVPPDCKRARAARATAIWDALSVSSPVSAGPFLTKVMIETTQVAQEKL